jgi:hypothetical protein
MKPQILFIFLAFILIASCKKEEVPEIYCYSLSESLKPYMFQQGSWWIYKNDSTEVSQSVLVTSTVRDTGLWRPSAPHTPGSKFDYYLINFYNSTTNETYNDFLTNDFIRRNGGDYYGENGQPILTPSADIGYSFNGMEMVDRIAEMTINGHVFTNIKKVKITAVDQYQDEFDYDTYLYFIDSIGLIKKETVIGEGVIVSWSIEDWDVLF